MFHPRHTTVGRLSWCKFTRGEKLASRTLHTGISAECVWGRRSARRVSEPRVGTQDSGGGLLLGPPARPSGEPARMRPGALGGNLQRNRREVQGCPGSLVTE